MIFNFSSVPILNYWHDLLYYFLNFNDPRHLNLFFHDLFNINRHFKHFLYHSLHWNQLLFNYMYLFYLCLNVINHFLYFNRDFFFNYFFDLDLNLLHCWNYFSKFHYFFDNSGYLDNCFYFVFIRNQFFFFSFNNHRSFNRNMNYLLNFLDLFDFNYFFNNFLDCYHFWDLNHSFNHFLDQLLNFYKFRSHSKDFKDVINLNHIHNFCFDHSKNSLINLKNNTSFNLDFF